MPQYVGDFESSAKSNPWQPLDATFFHIGKLDSIFLCPIETDEFQVGREKLIAVFPKLRSHRKDEPSFMLSHSSESRSANVEASRTPVHIGPPSSLFSCNSLPVNRT
jgi:hypothetical protein